MLKAVAGYGMRAYEKAVLKATWNDDTPTSEYHIEYLVQYSQRPTRGNIATAIQNRITEKAQWKVVLKAIGLIHRLIRNGDESFTKDLLHLPKLFTIKDYLDRSTSEAVGESQFIVQYVQYMNHKLHIYDELGYWIEKRFRESSSPMEWISSLPIQELQRIFPLLMVSFDKLTSCEPNVTFDSIHPIDSQVLLMLLKDSLRAYSFLTISIFYMIDKVDQFDTSVCEWMITQIAHFTKLNSKYKIWAQKLVSLHLVEAHFLPNFETIPTSTIANLQTLLVDRSQQAAKDKMRSRSATPKGKSSSRVPKKAPEYPYPNEKDMSSTVHLEVDLLGLGSFETSQTTSKGRSLSPISKSSHDNPFTAFDFNNINV